MYYSHEGFRTRIVCGPGTLAPRVANSLVKQMALRHETLWNTRKIVQWRRLNSLGMLLAWSLRLSSCPATSLVKGDCARTIQGEDYT